MSTIDSHRIFMEVTYFSYICNIIICIIISVLFWQNKKLHHSNIYSVYHFTLHSNICVYQNQIYLTLYCNSFSQLYSVVFIIFNPYAFLFLSFLVLRAFCSVTLHYCETLLFLSLSASRRWISHSIKSSPINKSYA